MTDPCPICGVHIQRDKENCGEPDCPDAAATFSESAGCCGERAHGKEGST